MKQKFQRVPQTKLNDVQQFKLIWIVYYKSLTKLTEYQIITVKVPKFSTSFAGISNKY